MAINFFSGFESGDMCEWESSTSYTAVQGATKKTGNYALRCYPDIDDAYLDAGISCTRCSFWLYIYEAPTSNTRICGDDTMVSVKLTKDRRLRLYDGAQNLGGTYQLDLNTWYRVSVGFDPTNNAAKLYINGKQEVFWLNVTSSSATGRYYGIVDAVNSAEIFIDDIVQDDVESTDDIGDIRVLKSSPNKVGSYTQFDNYVGSSIHYENVDEVSFLDSDYNYHETSTAAKDSYGLESCFDIGLSAGDVIKSVKTICRMARGSGGGSVHSILVRDNNSDYETEVPLTVDWDFYSRLDNVMPDDSQEWTQERFDSFEVGMSYDGGGRDPNISYAIVMIAFLVPKKKRSKGSPALTFGEAWLW